MRVVGLVAAVGAAGFYAAGLALQTLEARLAPREEALRPSLLRRLSFRPLWIAGTALGLAGWGLQALALLFAPLTLVQAALPVGLIALLAIGVTVLDEKVGRRELTSVAAITLGLGGLAAVAPAREAAAAGPAGDAAYAALLALAFVPYVARRRHGLVIAAAAGVAYSADGIATKFAADDYSRHFWAALGLWLVLMGIAAGLGTLSEMSALQERPATQVAPVVSVLTTLVPVALAPALVGERWPAGVPIRTALGISLLLVLIGTAMLARSEAVGRVLAGDPRSSDNETARRPLRPRTESTLVIVSDAAEAETPTETTTTSPASTPSSSDSPASRRSDPTIGVPPTSSAARYSPSEKPSRGR